MTTQHTQGRLIARGFSIYAAEGRTPVADTCLTASVPDNDEANARRLVACWNACAGIPTKALEDAGTIAVEVEDEMQAELLAAWQQRDELLAALEVMLRDYTAVHDIGDVEMQPAIYQARAAIAKVKGGEA